MKSLILRAALLVALLPMPRAFADDGPVATGAKGPQTIPAREFARHPKYQSIDLSPDGRRLAFTMRDRGGKSALVLYDIAAKKPSFGLRLADDDAIGSVAWVSGERVMIELARQRGSADSPARTGELFAINYDGKQEVYLFGYRGSGESGTRLRRGNEAVEGVASLIRTLPKDSRHALVSMSQATQSTADGRYYSGRDANLYRMDVYSGRLSLVARPPESSVSDYLADESGRPRLVQGYGDQSLRRRSYWMSEAGTWQLLDVPGTDHWIISLAEDGSRGYLAVEFDADRKCLMELAFAKDGPPSLREKVCAPPGEMSTFLIDSRGVPYGYKGPARRKRVVIDDSSIEAQALALLGEQFDERRLTVQGRSADGQQILFMADGDTDSGEYYFFDAKTSEASFFDARQPWLDPARMSTMQRHRYTTRDGLKIDAFLTVPQGLDAKSLPLVVMPHGGPIGVRDNWGWDNDAQFLASRGYAVLQMNYRGSGGYGKAFAELGHRQWGRAMIDDITDGARWAIREGIADPGRVCIFGGSYGGYSALMSAVREPDLYRCAIGYAGIYDLNLLVKDSDVVNTAFGRKFWDETMASSPEERAQQSPVGQMDRLKAAVMIVHGERDIRAPVSQAKALRTALDRQRIPYDWLVKADEGHGFFNEDNLTELYERLEVFLANHIGPVKTPQK